MIRVEVEAPDQVADGLLQGQGAEDLQAGGRQNGQQPLARLQQRNQVQSRMRMRIRVVGLGGHRAV
ncbi:hypothetical protein D3C81_2175790 [compost metagenome]